MGLDYYAILNVPRKCTLIEIKTSYRKLSIASHPNRRAYPQHPEVLPEPVDNVIEHLPTLCVDTFWKLLGEAFDVLSNELLRQVYDTYGEEGLKRGVVAPDGYIQPYKYHQDPMKTYKDAMSSCSPYVDLVDAVVNPPPLYATEEGTGVKVKDKDVEKLLYVDFKDIFYGCLKKVKIFRKELVDETQSNTKLVTKILDVEVPKGCLEGTKIRVPLQGDQSITRIPADFIFEIVHRSVVDVERKGSDMYMTFDIDLADALCGFTLPITTIDDRKLNIPITDVVNPDYVKRVSNEGFPFPNDDDQRGNLYISFRIKFPDYLNKSSKALLSHLLKK